MKETNINIEIITFPRQFGVEIEYFSETEVPCASYYAHKRRKVLYKYDSSLNGDDGFAVEVAIPFSYSTKRLLSWWQDQAAFANTVNESCGLHVHICMCNPGQEPSQRIKNIAARVWRQYYLLQKELDLIVYYSRVDNVYCRRLISAKPDWKRRRNAVNLTSLFSLGTIEFRQHHATLDYQEIVAWIHLCQAIVAQAEKGELVDNITELPLPAWVIEYYQTRMKGNLYNFPKPLEEVQAIAPKWLLNATTKNAIVTIKNNGEVIWHSGEWLDGDWFGKEWHYGQWRGGTWHSGTWRDGHWRGGTWRSGTWRDGRWEAGTWHGGTWCKGIWHDGVWKTGVWIVGLWHKGEWHTGEWKEGVWRKGTWNGGTWHGGEWRGGTWNGGTWNGGTWHGGEWRDGTWNAGEWRDGTWCSGNWLAGTWHGGLRIT